MTVRSLLSVSLAALLGVTLMANVHWAAAEKDKALRHVVCFKFKPDAKPEQVDGIVKAFAELPKKIDGIRAYESGTNNSPENLNKGFTHVFVVTFKDEAARTAYLPHPAHKAFVDQLKPILEDAFVVDYWTP